MIQAVVLAKEEELAFQQLLSSIIPPSFLYEHTLHGNSDLFYFF